MSSGSEPAALLDFAREFIRKIDHHSEVRTELLAESFRRWFELPPFPSLAELCQLCGRLDVQLTRPPTMPPGLPGVNIWRTGSTPEILLNEDLSQQRAETTFGHELREVIETAFKRVKPAYEGLKTSDNRTMNPESDQFAGCLLMQAEAARTRLSELGFDMPQFARDRGRSLPSVIMRSRLLYPSTYTEPGPVAGLWLFEAPWPAVEAGESTPDQMKMRYGAHLMGFSMRKRGTDEQRLAHYVFPGRGSVACQFPIVVRAIEERRALVGHLGGFDLFGERDFVLGAEPFFARGAPWRVLLTAVRRDCELQIQPWVGRLSGGLTLPALHLV